MAKRNSNSKIAVTDNRLQPEVAERLFEVLGPPPLFADEREDDYIDLLNQVRSAVSPKDVLEELWVRDVVDLVWEGLRLRRLKVSLAAAIRSDAIYDWILPIKEEECLDEDDEYNYLAPAARAEAEERAKAVQASWMNGDPETLEVVSDTLQAAGKNESMIISEAMNANFDAFERMDRLILQAEVRRNAALREIDRHREATARRLRDVVREIEDAEFEDLSSGESARVE